MLSSAWLRLSNRLAGSVACCSLRYGVRITRISSARQAASAAHYTSWVEKKPVLCVACPQFQVSLQCLKRQVLKTSFQEPRGFWSSQISSIAFASKERGFSSLSAISADTSHPVMHSYVPNIPLVCALLFKGLWVFFYCITALMPRQRGVPWLSTEKRWAFFGKENFLEPPLQIKKCTQLEHARAPHAFTPCSLPRPGARPGG